MRESPDFKFDEKQLKTEQHWMYWRKETYGLRTPKRFKITNYGTAIEGTLFKKKFKKKFPKKKILKKFSKKFKKKFKKIQKKFQKISKKIQTFFKMFKKFTFFL